VVLGYAFWGIVRAAEQKSFEVRWEFNMTRHMRFREIRRFQGNSIKQALLVPPLFSFQVYSWRITPYLLQQALLVDRFPGPLTLYLHLRYNSEHFVPISVVIK